MQDKFSVEPWAEYRMDTYDGQGKTYRVIELTHPLRDDVKGDCPKCEDKVTKLILEYDQIWSNPNFPYPVTDILPAQLAGEVLSLVTVEPCGHGLGPKDTFFFEADKEHIPPGQIWRIGYGGFEKHIVVQLTIPEGAPDE